MQHELDAKALKRRLETLAQEQHQNAQNDWTNKEDETLKDLYRKGTPWAEIPKYFKGRSTDSCKCRLFKLRKNDKEVNEHDKHGSMSANEEALPHRISQKQWTKREEDTLRYFYSRGANWEKMASEIEGVSADNCKHHWDSMRQRDRKRGKKRGRDVSEQDIEKLMFAEDKISVPRKKRASFPGGQDLYGYQDYLSSFGPTSNPHGQNVKFDTNSASTIMPLALAGTANYFGDDRDLIPEGYVGQPIRGPPIPANPYAQDPPLDENGFTDMSPEACAIRLERKRADEGEGAEDAVEAERKRQPWYNVIIL